MTILTPDVLAILILDFIFLFFSFIALILSFRIVLRWDITKSTPLQYSLEKESYLVATIIKYIFVLKIPLFLFFIFTLDKLSNVIPGAMCAAGVVNATVYGFYLLILKIINLYLFGFWLLLHHFDMKREDYAFVKIKFWLFIFIFFPFLIEIILEVLMFYNINPAKIVSCCGTLFSAAKSSSISSLMKLPHFLVVGAFYANFFLILLFYFLKRDFLFALFNFTFLFISILSLISFFSTYVYELPTHHCPFCLLQKDYYYVGYFLYIFLFIGTFFGMANAFIKIFIKRRISIWYNLSLIFNTFYVILITIYPIVYYIKNGVWL